MTLCLCWHVGDGIIFIALYICIALFMCLWCFMEGKDESGRVCSQISLEPQSSQFHSSKDISEKKCPEMGFARVGKGCSGGCSRHSGSQEESTDSLKITAGFRG